MDEILIAISTRLNWIRSRLTRADVSTTDEPFGAVVLPNGYVCVATIFIATQMVIGHDTLISPQGSDQFFAAGFDAAGNSLWP